MLGAANDKHAAPGVLIDLVLLQMELRNAPTVLRVRRQTHPSVSTPALRSPRHQYRTDPQYPHAL